jgi:CRP-like cAMP-binding protein
MAVPMDLLRNVELLGLLPAESLFSVAEAAVQVGYPQGSVLFHRAERTTNVYVVEKGVIGVFVQNNAGELLPISVLGPGKLAATTALLARQEHALQGRTLMDSTLLAIPARWIHTLMTSNPSIGEKVYEEMAFRLLQQVNRLVGFLSGEEVAVQLDERCPSLRATHVSVVADVKNREFRGLCHRGFPCSVEEGLGCPLAGKPALTYHQMGAALGPGTEQALPS